MTIGFPASNETNENMGCGSEQSMGGSKSHLLPGRMRRSVTSVCHLRPNSFEDRGPLGEQCLLSSTRSCRGLELFCLWNWGHERGMVDRSEFLTPDAHLGMIIIRSLVEREIWLAKVHSIDPSGAKWRRKGGRKMIRTNSHQDVIVSFLDVCVFNVDENQKAKSICKMRIIHFSFGNRTEVRIPGRNLFSMPKSDSD